MVGALAPAAATTVAITAWLGFFFVVVFTVAMTMVVIMTAAATAFFVVMVTTTAAVGVDMAVGNFFSAGFTYINHFNVEGQ